MAVEFQDFSIKVTEAMEEALIAALYEAAGELEARAKRNSRQGHEYGNIKANALWKYQVNEGAMEAQVGSEHEAGYWEEFGTGELAEDTSKSRNGWWVYIEGGSGYEGETNTYKTKAEAERMAAYIREKYNRNAYATNGQEPNRPLQRAFQEGKPNVEKIFAQKLSEL